MTPRPAFLSSAIGYSENQAGGPELQVAVPAELLEAIAEIVERRVLERLAAAEAAPEWLSIETAARYLDVSAERVRKLVARRAIPHYQEGPGCRVFLRRRELDEWMSRSRIAAAPERHA